MAISCRCWGLYSTVASLASWSNGLAASPRSPVGGINADRADGRAVNQTLKQHATGALAPLCQQESALKDLMAAQWPRRSLDGLAGQPLPDAFIVSPKTLNRKHWSDCKKELSGLPMVETSQFDAGWARKLHSLLTGPPVDHPAGAALGIALVLASSNTHPPADSGPAQMKSKCPN